MQLPARIVVHLTRYFRVGMNFSCSFAGDAGMPLRYSGLAAMTGIDLDQIIETAKADCLKDC